MRAACVVLPFSDREAQSFFGPRVPLNVRAASVSGFGANPSVGTSDPMPLLDQSRFRGRVGSDGLQSARRGIDAVRSADAAGRGRLRPSSRSALTRISSRSRTESISILAIDATRRGGRELGDQTAFSAPRAHRSSGWPWSRSPAERHMPMLLRASADHAACLVNPSTAMSRPRPRSTRATRQPRQTFENELDGAQGSM